MDHDGDGKIDFEDFSFGFRDFLVPGSRRGSIQLSLVPPRGGLQRGYTMEVVDEEKQKSMEVKIYFFKNIFGCNLSQLKN